MAATKTGQQAIDLFQKWHEVFVDTLSINNALITKAHLDPTSLTEVGQARWLDLMWQAHNAGFSEGVSRFNDFYRSFRYLETGSRTGAPDMVPKPLDRRELVDKLMVTGPQQLLKKKVIDPSGFASLESITDTCNYAAMSAQQMTMDATKQVALDTYRLDEAVTHIGRKAESGACRFCLMLVGRGAVYTEETARFESHRSCKCSPMPSFGEPFVADDTDRKELERIMEEGAKWQRDHVYAFDKVNKAAKEDMVTAGLLKKTSKEYPKYKTVTAADGTQTKVRDGVHVQVTYAKTQLARQGEAALELARTKGYKQIMRPVDQPLLAKGVTKDAADRELDLLRNLLKVNEVKGNDRLARYQANSSFLFTDPSEREALLQAARNSDVQYKKNKTMADKHIEAFRKAKGEVQDMIEMDIKHQESVKKARLAQKEIDQAEDSVNRSIDYLIDSRIYKRAAGRIDRQNLSTLTLDQWKARFKRKYPVDSIENALKAMGIPYTR